MLLIFEPALELPAIVVGIIFFTPLAAGVGIYFYLTRHAKLWRKGIFPPKLAFTQDHLLEAYLSLGAKLILLDYKNTKGKTVFINQYFNRYFKSANYDFGDSLLFSMRHPIQMETVCAWFKQHLKEEGKRAQVVYFLTGLAITNGQISNKELAFLQEINELLGLPESNLRRILAIYESYEKTGKENQEEESRRKPRTSALDTFRNILGVKSGATPVEIKKAYRTLAKLHHPDVFANASEAQQKMAEEKFVRIQEAYEALS